ncbi:ABC transporter permease DevC [Gloeocapsopsis dulcis]|uniref:ABC transporter n=1 Tax=Gloeocapsopsis dulcis AAB1 = 1H9 TaxID=1433147 RepID=A0A6N8FYF1_9CHRO|nr:ABC transporter permease DevC [Gloeocapsopsis dulcis]MUL38170.1 ABC transporter [Gloeocapsopsis dulcis AAB1 = 1H9]WNN90796.1 ABC transporter permease DevC [Gloeocapsopsis dulcis]
MIGFIQQLQRRTPLGWLQLSHEKGRLLVALAGIAFADVLMFMQLGFQNALYDSNTRVNRAMSADIVLLSPKALNLQNLSTFSRRRLFQARDIPGVQTATALYINSITWKNPQTRLNATVQVLGFAPDEPAFNLPEVNQQLDKLKLPDTVLFDRGARGQYAEAIAQVDRGKTVTTEVDRRTLTIAGVFSLGASFGADANLMVSDQTFLRLFPRRDAASVSLGLIQVKSGYDPQQVAAALESYLPEDVRVLTVQEYVQFEENYWRTASPIGFVFGLGTVMAFVVGVVIVYQVLSTDVNAHLKEYATFKAMGYGNSYLLSIVFEEAIILAFLGFIPGAILPLGLYALAANATALPIYMTASRAVFVLVLTVVMCALSGALSTRKLQSADPADMF